MSISEVLQKEITVLDDKYMEYLKSIQFVFRETPSLWYFIKTIESPASKQPSLYKMEVQAYSGITLPPPIVKDIEETSARVVANYLANIST